MKATEKEKISIQMIKAVDRIATKNELKRSDYVKMVLGLAECIVRFCVREGVAGCKKNSRKVTKITRETFIAFIERDYKDDSWWLKDDEEDKEDDE